MTVEQDNGWTCTGRTRSEGMARVPDGGLDRVIEAAEEYPGERTFIEVG